MSRDETTSDYRAGWSDCATIVLATIDMRINTLPDGDRKLELVRLQQMIRNTTAPRYVR